MLNDKIVGNVGQYFYGTYDPTTYDTEYRRSYQDPWLLLHMVCTVELTNELTNELTYLSLEL